MKAVIIKDGRELFNAHGDTLTDLIINLIRINEDRLNLDSSLANEENKNG